MATNPFPKLTAEAQRRPENKRLLDELGAYLISVVEAEQRPKHNKRYDFYEVIDDQNLGEGGDAE